MAQAGYSKNRKAISVDRRHQDPVETPCWSWRMGQDLFPLPLCLWEFSNLNTHTHPKKGGDREIRANQGLLLPSGRADFPKLSSRSNPMSLKYQFL